MIRTALASDVPAMQQLGLRAYGLHAAQIGPDSWTTMEQGLRRQGLYPELLELATGFVCEVEAGLAGMVFLVASGMPSPHFPPDWAYVRMLGVAPEQQGRGIARRLMEHCIETAKLRGERVLGLHTGAFMEAARKLYTSMGFQIEQELAPIFDQPYTRFRLSLS